MHCLDDRYCALSYRSLPLALQQYSVVRTALELCLNFLKFSLYHWRVRTVGDSRHTVVGDCNIDSDPLTLVQRVRTDLRIIVGPVFHQPDSRQIFGKVKFVDAVVIGLEWAARIRKDCRPAEEDNQEYCNFRWFDNCHGK